MCIEMQTGVAAKVVSLLRTLYTILDVFESELQRKLGFGQFLTNIGGM